jgi:hypothetical protein
MTYNFDPDRWYASHRAALEARRDRGELEEAAFEAALAELEQRYEDLEQRLDGTYEIPKSRND